MASWQSDRSGNMSFMYVADPAGLVATQVGGGLYNNAHTAGRRGGGGHLPIFQACSRFHTKGSECRGWQHSWLASLPFRDSVSKRFAPTVPSFPCLELCKQSLLPRIRSCTRCKCSLEASTASGLANVVTSGLLGAPFAVQLLEQNLTLKPQTLPC